MPPRRWRRSPGEEQKDGGDSQPRPLFTASQPRQSGKQGAGLHLPQMSADESARISVPFAEVGSRLCDVLEEHGVAVVTGVATPEECTELEKLFVEDLQELVDVKALDDDGAVSRAAKAALEDPARWPLASLECLGKMDRCQLRGLPHGRFAWAARLHHRVRQVYEVIHGTTALVSSCDNTFFAPFAQQAKKHNRVWPHVDFNSHDRSVWDENGVPVGEWDVFQGVFYVWGSMAEHSSTTAVWPGSHREVYETIMSDPTLACRGRESQFILLSRLASVKKALEEDWERCARRVPVPAGGLLLWNSRTTHQGWSGGPRLAQPVCWEPAIRRDELARERKLKMAAMGLPSTHWASLGLPHNLVNEKLPPATAPRVEGSGGHDSVVLPVKSTLRPATLLPHVDASQLWKTLFACDWTKALPEDAKETLEQSIDAKILAVL